MQGAAYWGKRYYGGGSGVANRPDGVNGYALEIIQGDATSTVQVLYSVAGSESSENRPTHYQRSYSAGNSTWSEWEELVTAEGNYPNLAAGEAERLSRRQYIGVGTGTPGWYKVGSLKVSDILSQSSATNTTSSFSMLFLVTGLNRNGINQTGVAHSGVFELECRMIAGAFADGNTNIKILAGDIRAEDYCYAMDTAGSEITLYCNLGGTYMATVFCILSEQYGNYATKAFTFDGTFESAEMPSGGTAGINVIRAAYDADGNDISDTYAKKDDMEAAMQRMYPIGSIYFSAVGTNPSELFGFGTWQAWGAGRVPVGVDASQTEFNAVEKTGGEKAHALTINEMPSHTHEISYRPIGDPSDDPFALFKSEGGITGTYNSPGTELSQDALEAKAAGGGQAHNNLQPYITCYMWKRTA